VPEAPPTAPTPMILVAPEPAPPEPEPEAEPEIDEPLSFAAAPLDVHGFVSQGAFLSTGNNYLGHSVRGSVELFEAGINFSTEPIEKLRVGLQLFTRDVGPIGNYTMGLDWAYLDYRVNPSFGVRAGRIKLPFGLWNEVADIDSARLPILLPQGIYPILSRDFLVAQTGFSLYGSPSLGRAGELDYQLFFGTLFIRASDLSSGSSQITNIDTKAVAGGQLMWRPPVEGLRLGGSVLYGNLAFDVTLDPATTAAFIAAGLAPAGFDGVVTLGIDPAWLSVGSIEYLTGPWSLTAEYSRWDQHATSSIPALIAPGTADTDSERFYGMAAYRFGDHLEAGAYYSVKSLDVHDRDGSGPAYATNRNRAFQRDLAATVRWDVNDAWLWKLEGHFMDGFADLSEQDENSSPTEYWGLFLVKTTVSF
jgi:hypothetical protein